MRETRAAAGKILDQCRADHPETENYRTKVTKALGSEGSGHHTTTNPSRSKLGGDDGGERIITADTNTHLNCYSAWVIERK
jgi:hypothetical protein